MEGFPDKSDGTSEQPQRRRIGTMGGKLSRNLDLGIEPVDAPKDYSTDPYSHPAFRQYTSEQIAEGNISMDDHRLLRQLRGEPESTVDQILNEPND